ncbi:MAG: primosomal protein N' [Paludibacter sp.]|nr:primosomal protein N' [Bacteroidales bacterium]MCM1068579.1 primosomal protein N' [Prevotella sp.]MCM1353243.1 primosomal protein N' [Bacteroides sp.]MCM1442349.1 primosomal protein N' [Muribaculum sp.]MCM1481168.1 primosomal protein N' [Paludibacter sp.]
MRADVVLPLAFEGVLTYNIPDEIAVSAVVGMRVLVPLGKKKIVTGVILSLSSSQGTEEFALKDIICLLDDSPIVNPVQIELWQWIASYYMCTLGEVMKAALPSALKLESETRIRLNEIREEGQTFTSTQQRVLEYLSDGKEKSIDEIGRVMQVKHVLPALDRLIASGAVVLSEHVIDRYRPRVQKMVSLHPAFRDENKLASLLTGLQKSKKQQALLRCYMQECIVNAQSLGVKYGQIERQTLLAKANVSAAILKSLETKGVLLVSDVAVGRLDKEKVEVENAHTLNPFQEAAYEDTERLWQAKDVVLLHGVTGSGKTEIYIQLINNVLAEKKQVLYMVPEIALTTQLTDRLRAVFGSRLGVYHSRFSDAERVEIYKKVQSGEYEVVLGVRSSLFLPFDKLGLVVVDEEHDASYKQQEPAPRYNARNTVIVLAGLHGAKVLLGTATPAIETYYNALNGKYGLVSLKHRHNDVEMPDIRLIDTRRQYHRKEMMGHFSDVLVHKISDEIGREKQVIVFQNRRGYAPYVECKVCAYIPKCVHCDVSMTLHKHQQMLVCHYCGYAIQLPDKCPVCGKEALADRGFGTEKIEDEMVQLFPTARIARMDLDTTRNKNSYERLIADFESHSTDILVGTQMISKGLHFDDVSLVAVLNADNLMNQPTFRAYEYAFQMLEQVSGRAGRKKQRGDVYIQTSNPENRLFKQLVQHDYESFYAEQIEERRLFKYPPFYRLLEITLRHRDLYIADTVSAMLQQQLKVVFTRRCSSVVIPLVSRVQNMYVRKILLKIEADASYARAKMLLKQSIEQIRMTEKGKSVSVYVDVDPM